MEHNIRLFEEPFELIKSGKKIIEIRLNDEKRQKVKIGDTIIFSKLPECQDCIKVKVLGLLHFNSFKQLYEDIPAVHFGHEGRTMKEKLDGIYEIYTKEQEEKYGALGIRIKLYEYLY